MTYDHRYKAGNRADVWKHYLLITLMDDLCETRQLSRDRFCYVDTHAGHGLYNLKDSPGWHQGIGRFGPQDKDAHPYFRITAGYLAQNIYPGSWMLVHHYLKSRHIEADIRLFDTSGAVSSHLEVDSMLPPGVTYRQSDGFAAARQEVSADLILIDPPYHPEYTADRQRTLDLLADPAADRAVFVAWFPLLRNRQPLEAAGCTSFEIHWGSPEDTAGDPMYGCGMMLPARAGQMILPHTGKLESLARHLGGELIVRYR
ncbi:MAG: 23S rRNA (adenine(2030)-N(6))-methyltransferase RlmJ [Sedimenticola sp.]